MELQPSKRFQIALSVFLFFSAIGLWRGDALHADNSHLVKAAFVHKFLLFTDFPRVTNSRPEIRICIVGANPFGESFRPVEGSAIRGRTLRVERLTSTTTSEHLSRCDLVFLSENNSPATVREVLQRLEGLPILTVGEHSGFLAWNGMIRIFEDKDRMAFSVNIRAASEVGVAFRSQMLRIAAEVVREEKN